MVDGPAHFLGGQVPERATPTGNAVVNFDFELDPGICI